MKRSTLLLTAALILATFSGQAQSKLGVYLGGGMMYYEGDLKETIFPNPLTLGWDANVGLVWDINHRWAIDLGYHFGRIMGDDQYAVSPSKRERGLKFESLVHDISIRGQYFFLRTDRWTVSPYITAGVGVARVNPKRDGVALQPLQTEGVAYSIWNVTFPTGVGLRYNINCNWSVKAEAVYRWTLTDYLDDVSGAYPDAENEVAFFTDPGNVAPPRAMRGNPAFKDGYFDVNVGVIFFFVGCGNNRKGGMIEDCKKLNDGVDIDMMNEMYK